MHLKKRPHIEPGIDTFGKPSEKGNRITPGLQGSRGVEHRRVPATQSIATVPRKE